MVSGAVSVTVSLGEHTHVMDSKFEGDIVGEISVLTGLERTATLRAKTKVEVLSFEKENVLEALETRCPHLAWL